MPGKYAFILLALALLLGSGPTGAVAQEQGLAPIPPKQRIEAKLVRMLVAPADGPMHMPTDIAIDGDDVYIADGANHRVLRFSTEGSFKGVLQSAGTTLKRPVGLGIDHRRRVWVADTGNQRLVVFDGDQTEIIALPALGALHPVDPTDVAVTPDGGKAYVVDNDNHRILIRDNNTGQFTPLGRYGRGLGQLEWPFLLAMAPDGDVFISEAIGARVQQLGAAERWVGQIGRWGMELGQLYRPKGVAVDAKGRIHVSDSTTGVVQAFTSRGECLGLLTTPEGSPMRFLHPMGMAFDQDGLLYIVELRADRVAVVKPAGEMRYKK